MAFFISFDFKGTFAFIVLMRTQEDNPGNAVATIVRALFFKNVRLLFMIDQFCNVIRAEMNGASYKTRYVSVQIY